MAESAARRFCARRSDEISERGRLKPTTFPRTVRVALVYEHFNAQGSLERGRLLLARGLVELGVEVHSYADPQSAVPEPGVTPHPVSPALRGSSRVVRALQYASFARRATYLLRSDRGRYDIIDVAGTTAWEHDVIRVHAVQKRELERWPARGGQTFRAATIRARMAPFLHPRIGVARLIEERQLQGNFSCAIAVTNQVKQDLIDVYALDEARVAVVPPPVDTEKFAAARPGSLRAKLGLDGKPLVLFVGHDFRRKGLADAIDAIATLSCVHLVVVGDGPRESFEQQTARLGISERVHFAGGTSKPEAAFADADLLVLPTHEDVWGNTLIEGLAAGVPVVTTTMAGAAEIINGANAGVIVPPASPRALREAVESILRNASKRDELAAGARAAAAAFGIGAHAAHVLEVYEAVLRKRTRLRRK